MIEGRKCRASSKTKRKRHYYFNFFSNSHEKQTGKGEARKTIRADDNDGDRPARTNGAVGGGGADPDEDGGGAVDAALPLRLRRRPEAYSAVVPPDERTGGGAREGDDGDRRARAVASREVVGEVHRGPPRPTPPREGHGGVAHLHGERHLRAAPVVGRGRGRLVVGRVQSVVRGRLRGRRHDVAALLVGLPGGRGEPALARVGRRQQAGEHIGEGRRGSAGRRPAVHLLVLLRDALREGVGVQNYQWARQHKQQTRRNVNRNDRDGADEGNVRPGVADAPGHALAALVRLAGRPHGQLLLQPDPPSGVDAERRADVLVGLFEPPQQWRWRGSR